MSYKFFRNDNCEFFPCHNVRNVDDFNCLVCFCPLYHMDKCGGEYTILDNGIKDCTQCSLPHYNYNYIIRMLVNEESRGIE